MLQDLINNNAFLQWYLNPRGRITRKTFNTIAGVLFLIVIAFAYPELKESAETMQKSMGMGMSAGMYDRQNRSSNQPELPEGLQGLSQGDIMAKLQQMQNGDEQAQKDLMNLVKMVDDNEDASSFSWAYFMNDLITLLMLPLVMMRLRDMGRTEDSIKKLTIWMYLFMITDFLGYVGIDVTAFIEVPINIISLVLFSWICMAKSEEYIPPSQRVQVPQEAKPSMPDPTPMDRKNDQSNDW